MKLNFSRHLHLQDLSLIFIERTDRHIDYGMTLHVIEINNFYKFNFSLCYLMSMNIILLNDYKFKKKITDLKKTYKFQIPVKTGTIKLQPSRLHSWLCHI